MRAKPTTIGIVMLVLGSVALNAGAEPPRVGQPAPPAWLARAARVQTPVALEMAPGLAAAGGTWVQALGGPAEDDAYLLRITSDGGYVFGGSTQSFGGTAVRLWLFKTDANGLVLWSKAYAAPGSVIGSFQITPDGGYMAAGSYSLSVGDSNLFVAKLDSAGTVTWAEQLGSIGTGYGGAITLGDNGALVYANTFSYNTLQSTVLLLRLNSSGGIVWQRQLTSSQYLFLFPTVQPGGGIVLLGQILSADFASSDALAVLADSSGNVQWQKTFSGPESEFLAGVLPAGDGGFLLSGTISTTTASNASIAGEAPATDGATSPSAASTTTSKILLMRISSSAGITWQKTVGGTGADFGILTPGSSGHFFLSGGIHRTSPSDEDILLANMDANGNFSWAETLGSPDDEDGIAVLDPVGGILMVGSKQPAGSAQSDQLAGYAAAQAVGGGQFDGLVGHLDGNGVPAWFNGYGGPADDTLYTAERLGYAQPTPGAWQSSDISVGALATGDLFLTGYTTSYGAGGNDVWAAHLDGNGGAGGSCPFVWPLSLTRTTFTLTPTAASLTVANAGLTVGNASRTAAAITLTAANVTPTATNLCTATPGLSATASASATSGTTPLTVNFTGQASNGTPPYTWDWNFGDGTAHSTQQNPSHIYTLPGVYQVTLTVHDSAAGTATDTHLSITVSSGGGCTLSCSATVPATGTTGVAVAFAGSATASGCAGSPTYLWNFGDNTTSSTAQNPSHTYAQAGSYSWSLTVVAGSGVCTKSGTIVVSAPSANPPGFAAGMAHASGALSSVWRSNLAAVNRTGSTASLTLTYVPYGGGTPIIKTDSLAGNATKEWNDLLVSLFGLSSSASVKGTVKIASSGSIASVARTYNQGSTGTFGQYLPLVPQGQELVNGDTGTIPLLKNNSAFRSNIGLLNTGTVPATATIKLRNATGAQVGSTKTQTVAVGDYWQLDGAFAALGAGTQNVAYATVAVNAPGGSMWAFGSVVDNVTNDPTTVPVVRSASVGPFYIAGIAHAIGALSSVWRSNVGAVYPGTGPNATLTLTYVPYGGGTTVVKTATLAPGAAVEWQDILVSLFGFASSASIKGTVKITSTQPIVVVARTYNQGSSGTFGQYLPAVTASLAFGGSTVGVIPLVKNNAAFRSNLGLLNVGSASCTVRIKLYNGSGAQVGSTHDQAVAAGQYWQQDGVFPAFGAGTQNLAYATVQVLTAGGSAWAFGSVVDNGTNDPTTVPVVK